MRASPRVACVLDRLSTTHSHHLIYNNYNNRIVLLAMPAVCSS